MEYIDQPSEAQQERISQALYALMGLPEDKPIPKYGISQPSNKKLILAAFSDSTVYPILDHLFRVMNEEEATTNQSREWVLDLITSGTGKQGKAFVDYLESAPHRMDLFRHCQEAVISKCYLASSGSFQEGIEIPEVHAKNIYQVMALGNAKFSSWIMKKPQTQEIWEDPCLFTVWLSQVSFYPRVLAHFIENEPKCRYAFRALMLKDGRTSMHILASAPYMYGSRDSLDKAIIKHCLDLYTDPSRCQHPLSVPELMERRDPEWAIVLKRGALEHLSQSSSSKTVTQSPKPKM